MAKPDGPWRKTGWWGMGIDRKHGWHRYYSVSLRPRVRLQARVIHHFGPRAGALKGSYEWILYGPGRVLSVLNVILDGGFSKTLAGAKRAADRGASLTR